ncbi:MAG TPA: NUDIX domain-containing protein [Acidimicrobiia bacterium]|nr:NUDIX domain-containing protein [Acidimicrobiia bacterium]
MIPRPAATVMLVRSTPYEPEVLMIERPARGFFGGLWVFPGGGLEPIDHENIARRAVRAPDGVDDLSWRAAALRETAEEVGLAITDPELIEPVTAIGVGVFETVLSRGAVLDGERLRLVSQWVTPEGAPTRFDTRFYVAVLDSDPDLVPQPGEVIDTAWIRPAEALDRMERQEWALVTPTIHHLQWLARHADIDSIWHAAGQALGSRVEPVVEYDGSEVRIQLPTAAELP